MEYTMEHITNRCRRTFKTKKAQTAFEFILLIGFLFLLFSAMLIVLKIKLSDANYERQQLLVQKYQNYALDEIALAQAMHDGYNRIFTIPPTFYGAPYEISINGDNSLVLKIGDDIHFKLLPPNVHGEIHVGSNLLIKQNGEINLSKI